MAPAPVNFWAWAVLRANINKTTATNVFFTVRSLAVLLPYLIVYGECYGDLNRGALLLRWFVHGPDREKVRQ